MWRFVSQGTGLSREYIMSRPVSWLVVEAEALLESAASDKQWDMLVATLTHAPQDQKGVRSYNKRMGEISKSIMAPINSIKRRRERNKPIVSSSWVKLEPGEKMEDFR